MTATKLNLINYELAAGHVVILDKSQNHSFLIWGKRERSVLCEVTQYMY